MPQSLLNRLGNVRCFRVRARMRQGVASQTCQPNGALGFEWRRTSSTCLGCYRIFGRSMYRTSMLEVGDWRSPRAGDSHCGLPQLKPDKQLLINSQAVYRPSLVENSRVTMSSVEQ
jgi:hypothetical protein